MKYQALKHYSLIFSFVIAILLLPTSAWSQDWVYVVSDGDNLWDLSEKHLDRVTRFEQVRKLNNIKFPKRLQPGTRIRIPMKWIRSNPVPATIIAIEGSAEITSSGNNKARQLEIGNLATLGDEIRTEDNSTVAIQFADGSILTVQNNSRVRFDHLSAHGSTGMVDSRLRLLNGRMDTKVTPAKGPGSRFEIHTPSAISAVRGTIYRAAVSDNGKASNIEVLKGKVAVTGAKKQQLISAGYGTQVVSGKRPIPPRQLLSKPDLLPIPERIREINWRLQWQPLTGAVSYRIEIAKDNRFDTLLWQQLSEHNRSAIPDLPDGNYFVRVRGIDTLGLEGLNHTRSIILDAHPQPPIALEPVDGQILRGQAPELRWTKPEGAARYRLEIAADNTFKTLLVDEKELTTSRFTPSDLNQTGTYYWRLTSIAADAEVGPVGRARAYQIKPIPEKVDANLSTLEDGGAIASWKPGNSDARYQVQIAYDKKFSDITLDQVLTQAQIEIPPSTGLTRYLRVKQIEADGFEGPWGTTQKILPPPDRGYWFVIIGTILGFII